MKNLEINQIRVFILVYKTEINSINGFFDRKTITVSEAKKLNNEMANKDLIWVLTPNY
jgi:hypothetical protein